MPDIATKPLDTELPPSLPAGLLGGHFRAFWRDRTGFLTRLAELGDVTYFRLGNHSMYFINHPDLIRDVLVVNAHKFIKGRALQRSKTLLGKGLLTSEHDFHLRQRRMIQPAFHRRRIAEYAEVMVAYAERTSDIWRDGDVLDIDREMLYLTLQIVGKTLFNAEVDNDADRIGAAMNTMVGLFNFLLLPFSEWLEKLPLPHSRRFNEARQTLDEIVYGMISERRRSGRDEGDLLSMLLLAQDEDDGTRMTDEQVRDEALTLFLAGHETTANALTWTWYLLSQNPEAENKLHEELDLVLPGRSPTFEDLSSLPFTETVLAESMRLYPPAWAIGRSAIEEHSIGGFRVPVGTVVLLSPFVLQRDARFWPEPLSFDPARWLRTPVKEAGRQYTYVPFGGGVRRCIGEGFAWAEGILLIASLARRWRLRLGPDQQVGVRPQITLRPKNRMRMRVEAR